MPETTVTDAAAVSVRRYFERGGRCGLYAPSVIAEATELLRDFYAAAAAHDLQPNDFEFLTTAAVDAVTAKIRRPPRPARTLDELTALRQALTTAFAERGLTPRPGRTIAVGPVDGGPRWGPAGGGLAVGIYLNGNWDLIIDNGRSPVHSIYAPATAAGAGEVATLVHDVLTGTRPDPFRDH